jgi:hypothetical protein
MLSVFPLYSNSLQPVPTPLEEKKIKTIPRSKVKLKANQGYDWNPFLKYPRNESCYCGSKKKYKNCCIDSDTAAIPQEIVEAAKPLVKKLRNKRVKK